MHLHRVRADVLPDRRRALPVRAAGRGGGLRDARLVRSVAHAGADAGACTCCGRAHDSTAPQPRNPLARIQRAFERGFERLRGGLSRLLDAAWSAAGACSCRVFLLRLRRRLAAGAVARRRTSFPTVDTGQFKLHLRAKTGTRIEETARLADLVEAVDPRGDSRRRARQHPRQHRAAVQRHQLMYSRLRRHRRRTRTSWCAEGRPSADRRPHPRAARAAAGASFRASTFYFLPADIVDADPQFRPAGADRRPDRRPRTSRATAQLADQIAERAAQVPGLADLRIQQHFDYPSSTSSSTARRPSRRGFTQRDVANSLLRLAERQLPDRRRRSCSTGRTASATTSSPRRRSTASQSLQDLQNIPISSPSARRDPQILGDVASITRGSEHGGGLALQHPPGRRHLRVGARPRPRRAWAAMSTGSWTRTRAHLPRGQLRDRARSARDDAHVVTWACWAGSDSRSCSSTC